MRHEILGELELSEGRTFDAVATIPYGSRTIRVGISRDGEPLEVALNLAAEVVRRLAELDEIAKRIAVRDLRNTYNNGWNEYDEAQEDGTSKDFVNPQLSEAEFAAKLSLNGVNITGDDRIHFFYDDENMFWGHTVCPESRFSRNPIFERGIGPLRAKSIEQQIDARQLKELAARVRATFVVFAQPPIPTEPTEGALDNPSFR